MNAQELIAYHRAKAEKHSADARDWRDGADLKLGLPPLRRREDFVAECRNGEQWGLGRAEFHDRAAALVEKLESDNAALRAELEAERAEGLEQARLNGMGGEREAKLIARAEQAEADNLSLRGYGAHMRDRLEQSEAALAEAKQRILDDNEAYGCELLDPAGTIWDHAKKLEAQLAEARRDSERLDWLLKTGLCWKGCDKENPPEHWVVGENTEWLYGQNRGRERLDAAIDAARGIRPECPDNRPDTGREQP